MASDTNNVKLGVCRVYFDGVDLGYTQGGVDVTVTTDTRKVLIDQFGKTPVNESIEGRNCTVKCPLAETTLRNLVRIMPGATLVTDGVQASATLTFTVNATAGQTLTINGTVFTYQVANPTTLYQVKIGATATASVQAMSDAVNLALTDVLTSASSLVLTMRAVDPGTAGNAFTVARTAGTTLSSATLLGGVAETRSRVDVVTAVGTSMLSIVKQLRLHPIAKLATDLSEDFIVPRTATAGALQFAFKNDAERVYNVEFMAYADPVTGKLFSVGDPLAV